MQVKDLMNPRVVSVRPDETAQTAAQLLAQHDLGALPVCGEDGSLRGMVTDRDIVLRCVAPREDLGKTPVHKVMTRTPATVSPGDDVRAAARLMAGRQVRRLPVVEEGRVVGVLSLGDLSASRACELEAAEALAEISRETAEGR